MQPLQDAAFMLGLFLLRLGVPLAVTVLVTWGLHRLDARWQAEAEARRADKAVAAGKVEVSAVMAPVARKTPCWKYRQCAEADRSRCAACQRPDLPCWMVRLRAEGRLPGRCYGCERFTTRPPLSQVVV